MRRKQNVFLVVSAMLAVVVICGTAPVWAVPSNEKGPRCSDGIDNDGDGLIDGDDPDCGGDGDGGGEFQADGAVGHDIGCLACNDPSCAEGDFHDIGTIDNGCELLTCGSGNGKDLVCGRQGDPKPKIDINGLYGLWGGNGQGDPTECFGNGIVGSTVHLSDQGKGGQILVILAFPGGVDGTLPGRCSGADDLVRYRVEVEGCTTLDSYPPGPGETTLVDCPPGALVDVATGGGGGIAKKCGCVTEGVLADGVALHFDGK